RVAGRGARVGWGELVGPGGRAYIGQTLLVRAGMPPALGAAPAAGYDDGDYPGFDYPGTAYAPTFSVPMGPRWPHRRWTRGQQRAAGWRALPPPITAPAARSPARTLAGGTATRPPPLAPVR